MFDCFRAATLALLTHFISILHLWHRRTRSLAPVHPIHTPICFHCQKTAPPAISNPSCFAKTGCQGLGCCCWAICHDAVSALKSRPRYLTPSNRCQEAFVSRWPPFPQSLPLRTASRPIFFSLCFFLDALLRRGGLLELAREKRPALHLIPVSFLPSGPGCPSSSWIIHVLVSCAPQWHTRHATAL